MEQDNKRILSNSIILYIRLIFTSIIGLVVTRVILKNLGIDDFGIYSVIGGVVTLIGFINTVMLSTSNRFIAFELGKGTTGNINKIFNVCLNIHAAVALLALLLGVAIGEWYIHRYINIPDGKLIEAIWVFRFSLLGSIVSFVGVPYIGLLLAKEKFLVFCAVDILMSVCKLIISYEIVYVQTERLVVYAALMAVVTALPTILYAIYCNRKYLELIRYRFYRKWSEYKEIFGFSVWIGYGALASVAKMQGAALIINYFFGAALNSALGVAFTVNSVIVTFAGNVGKAISPQITKSYAAGNIKRTEDLVIADSKYTFFLLTIPALPILLEIDAVLKLWLTVVPPYTGIFIKLMMVDALIGALNAGVPNAIFATGNIKWYQLIINTLFLLSLPIAFVTLKMGAEPYALLYAYIGVSFVALFVRQILLYRIVKFNTKRLLIKSYLPAFLVSLSVSPTYFLLRTEIHPMLVILISICYLLVLIFLIGLTSVERKTITHAIRSKLTRQGR